MQHTPSGFPIVSRPRAAATERFTPVAHGAQNPDSKAFAA
jgi:hypothetical protein